MSQTALIVQDDLQHITLNVAHMKREKSCLEVRQSAIARTLRRMELQLVDCDDAEEEQSLQDLVENLSNISSDLETYRSNLEIELDKVDRGIKMLNNLPDQVGRKAFAAYVTEDTELSVKNLAQVRSYYDQVILTLKKLSDNTIT